MNFTVLGARGFIGRHLVVHLRALGHEVFAPGRNDADIFRRPLGNVIYCIGLTADFRRRPFDTVRAHVSVLAEVLERADFDSLLYLSSTRVYAKSDDTRETSVLPMDPGDPSDLYNLSKLMGESICLNSGRANARVARLSNVVGHDPNSDNFLSTLIQEALSGHILLRSAYASAKDYILLDDVLALLPRIALEGRERIYNVASGRNIENRALVERLGELTGCTIEVDSAALPHNFSPVRVDRLHEEFPLMAADPLAALSQLVAAYRLAVNS